MFTNRTMDCPTKASTNIINQLQPESANFLIRLSERYIIHRATNRLRIPIPRPIKKPGRKYSGSVNRPCFAITM